MSVSFGEKAGGRRPTAQAGPATLDRPERLISQPRLIGFVLLGDVGVVAATGLCAAAITRPPTSTVLLAAMIALIALLFPAILRPLWGYTVPALSGVRRQLGRIAAALALALGALVFAAFVAGADPVTARPWILGWAALAAVVLTLGRLLVARLIRRWNREGRLARRAVIVGGGAAVSDMIDRLSKAGSDTIRILGIFDDRDGERSPETVGGYRKLGRFDELVDFCREQRIDLLIVTLPQSAESRILHLLKKLWVLPIDIRISAHGSRLKLQARAYSFIGTVPFLAVFDKPLTDWEIAVKAVEDRVLAAALIVLLSPVMLLVALAVRLESRGPALFRQVRYGFNNERIEVFKFRSMYVDQADASASRLVTRDDPRVTRVGRFIRRTSLDELPQLFNVVRGQLSLVGPRPHALQAKAGNRIYDEVIDGYFARHRVKPGITGWAQINGWRGETDTVEKLERRVEHDLHYIENWSVFFDLYILAMTPISLTNTRNAY